MEWMVYGTICSQLKSIESEQILTHMSTYNTLLAASNVNEINTLRLSHRKCMLEKFKSFIDLKKSIMNSSTLNSSEISSVGGSFLTGIRVDEILEYTGENSNTLGTWLYEIGRLPISNLMGLYGNDSKLRDSVEWFFKARIFDGIRKD